MKSGGSDRDGIAILGPTGIGKTGVSIEVARKINGEIVGLDSRQIYRGLEIGSAQPGSGERQGIPHHLIGCLAPDQVITAGAYAKMVIEKVDEIRNRGNMPVICGGAGLYWQALTRGLFKESASFPEIRKTLEAMYDRLSGEDLLARLEKLDPDYARIVHPNNRKRLVRALEIYEGTGKIPTEHFRIQREESSQRKTINPYSVLLTMKRNLLLTRLADRMDAMFENGWIGEVQALLKQYEKIKLPPLDSIGYREICAYLEGGSNLDELKKEILIKTRQYARRQKQWFNRETMDLKVDIDQEMPVEVIAEEIVAAFEN